MTDASTSPERQVDAIESHARLHGDVVIGWAIDIDVSGSVSPFDAPELGKWLTDEPPQEYDAIYAAALDRVGRRVIPLNQLFGWMMERNKTLVCIRDNIDLSHWVGRLIANVIAGVAEGELEAITDRIKSSNKKLVELGRWPGGKPPYGHVPQKVDNGWFLVEDPQASATINMIGDLLIDGNAVDWIRDQLNEQGVLTPSDHFQVLKGKPTKGRKWTAKTIWDLMQKKSLLGHAIRYKETVRDAEGAPVLYGDPLMPKERFDLIQDALAARRTGPARTRNTSPLLGVGFCYDCERQLSHRDLTRNYGKEQYRYYHCFHRDCPNKVMMNADLVESTLEEHFLVDVGDEPELKKVYIRPSNYTQELIDAKESYADVSRMYLTAKSKTMKSDLEIKMNALDSRIEVLENMPVEEGGYKYHETGRTYAEAWLEAKTPEDRRKLLLKYGVTIRIKQTDRTRTSVGQWTVHTTVPDDLKLRMSA